MNKDSKEVKDNKCQHNLKCKKCKENFVYHPKDTYWDDNGYGYSVKLIKCPFCGCINVVKYYEDRGLYVNYDNRYY